MAKLQAGEIALLEHEGGEGIRKLLAGLLKDQSSNPTKVRTTQAYFFTKKEEKMLN